MRNGFIFPSPQPIKVRERSSSVRLTPLRGATPNIVRVKSRLVRKVNQPHHFYFLWLSLVD